MPLPSDRRFKNVQYLYKCMINETVSPYTYLKQINRVAHNRKRNRPLDSFPFEICHMPNFIPNWIKRLKKGLLKPATCT